MKTLLLLNENFLLTECEAEAIEMRDGEGGQEILLNQTVFYPQGGGQPSDKGEIHGEGWKMTVEKVVKDKGEIVHIGKIDGEFKPGKVICNVDKERRLLNSKLHTAGHLVDYALKRLKLDFVPVKAYHYPEGPYCEYGNLTNLLEKEALKTAIDAELKKILDEGHMVKANLLKGAEAKQKYEQIPNFIKDDEIARVVVIGDKFGIGCGGTHVGCVSEISEVKVRKIKNEGNSTRICYEIEK